MRGINTRCVVSSVRSDTLKGCRASATGRGMEAKHVDVLQVRSRIGIHVAFMAEHHLEEDNCLEQVDTY